MLTSFSHRLQLLPRVSRLFSFVKVKENADALHKPDIHIGSSRFPDKYVNIDILPRTVSDDILLWTFKGRTAETPVRRYYPQLNADPPDLQVTLRVDIDMLKLTETEKHRLIIILGPRYLFKDRVIQLKSARFPHRIENKRYLMHLLEIILKEAKDAKYDKIEAEAREISAKKRELLRDHCPNPHLPEFVRHKLGYVAFTDEALIERVPFHHWLPNLRKTKELPFPYPEDELFNPPLPPSHYIEEKEQKKIVKKASVKGEAYTDEELKEIEEEKKMREKAAAAAASVAAEAKRLKALKAAKDAAKKAQVKAVTGADSKPSKDDVADDGDGPVKKKK